MARKRFLVSSEFMVACFCPLGRIRRRLGGGRPFVAPERRGKPGADRRRARRTDAEAPRAGPSARNRDRPASQGATPRAGPLSAGGGCGCARQRRRPSLVTVKPMRAPRPLVGVLAARRLQREGFERPPPPACKRAETPRAASGGRSRRPAGRPVRPCPEVAAPSAASHRAGKGHACGGGPAAGQAIRRKASCGRGRGGRSAPCGRRRSPCGRGSRGAACERACWVDRSASRSVSKVARRLERARPASSRQQPGGEPGKNLRRFRAAGSGAYAAPAGEVNRGRDLHHFHEPARTRARPDRAVLAAGSAPHRISAVEK